MRTVCAMLLALFICLLVLRNCAAVKRKEKGRGDRDKSAIDDAIYDVLIRMIEGERLPAVKDRTEHSDQRQCATGELMAIYR